jgi:hypothetical protein
MHVSLSNADVTAVVVADVDALLETEELADVVAVDDTDVLADEAIEELALVLAEEDAEVDAVLLRVLVWLVSSQSWMWPSS